jgi:TRAP-type uncharacterized transport system fused permease subunit
MGQFFNDLALALADTPRRSRQGLGDRLWPFGFRINCSAVVQRGDHRAFTIPLMEKDRYSAEFAGAVRILRFGGADSFLPPIMGAAAFTWRRCWGQIRLHCRFGGHPRAFILIGHHHPGTAARG